MSVYSYLNSLLVSRYPHFSFDTNNHVDGLLVKSATGEQVPTAFALLKIWISPQSEELKQLYRQHISQHNMKVLSSTYMDAGFDLFLPEEVVFSVPFQSKMVPLGVKTEMLVFQPGVSSPTFSGFDMRPRSSISKSQLMLSNHIGTIDSGYRGELMGAFRWLPVGPQNYVVEKHTRLLQICHPTLCPVFAVLVDLEEELSTTERGDGGFGSTGLSGIVH